MERQYLDTVRAVLDTGHECADRTGTGIKSLFGACHMKCDLSNHQFPLLTTKRMFIKGIVEELLWFVNGRTDSKELEQKGVTIWKANAREDGDCGPIYGFQFRHYGAPYIDCHTDYTGRGVDQIQRVVDMIKTDPTSRRLLINLWNPVQIDEMVLPPCHVLYHFRVYNNTLSCLLYQRSGDMGLGVPFNMASAALLTCMMAKLTDLEPGELIHVIGDAHVYTNHETALREQLRREPYACPRLHIRDRGQRRIEDFVADDFKIEEYKCHGKLPMPMAV
jgi:thymidylate synthase